MSWVRVRLAPEGKRTRLVLEHIAHRDGGGSDHLKTHGPGATGIGWDLGFRSLGEHLASGRPVDAAEAHAWMASSEGKAFIQACGEAWAEADAAAGEDREEARAKGARTIAFYTGG